MVKAWYGLVMFIGLMLPQVALAADATASLDHAITSSQESVQLTIHVNGGADHDPDLSVLKQDFEVLSQSQNSSYSLINGSMSRSKDWQFTLMPKHVGVLQIPPISLGNVMTNGLSLKVVDAASQVPQSQHPDVYLQITASPVDVYVQSQVLVTVKLFRAVNLTQAQLSEPEAKQAIVKRLGEDKNYQTIINQRRYVVTERQYAIFPQQSGMLHIPAVVMSGQVGDGMGFFNQGGRVIRVHSKDLNIQVEPMPSRWDATLPWLPASAVTLREIPNAHAADSLHVGDSLTRTIEIRVHGLTAEQLPPLLTQSVLQGWKQYPDKPELKTEVDAQGVIGVRREKIALIPTQAGDLSLPAIDVAWWNTKTHKIEHAIVLKRMVSVAANAASSSGQQAVAAPSSQSTSMASVPAVDAKANQVDQQANHSSLQLSESGERVWQGISAVLGMGWLLTLLWMGYDKQRQRQHQEQALRAQQRSLKSARKNLQKACQTEQAQAAKEALLDWANCVYAEPDINLAQLKGKSAALDEALEGLQRYLYSGHQEGWDAMQLWHAIESLDVQTKEQNESSPQVLSNL